MWHPKDICYTVLNFDRNKNSSDSFIPTIKRNIFIRGIRIVPPYLEWVLTFCTDFTLKVLLHILSAVNILNIAYPSRPMFYLL